MPTIKEILEHELANLPVVVNEVNNTTWNVKGQAGEAQIIQLKTGNCVVDSKNPALRTRLKDILDKTVNTKENTIENAIAATETTIGPEVESKKRGRPAKPKTEKPAPKDEPIEKEPEIEEPKESKYSKPIRELIDYAKQHVEANVISEDEDKIVINVVDLEATIYSNGSILTESDDLRARIEKKLGFKQTPLAEEVEESKPEIVESPKEVIQETKGTSIFDRIVERYGHDLFEVFSDTGHLKSKGFVALALDATKNGKKVFFLDTENNIIPSEKKMLQEAGVEYKYTPVLTEIDQIITKEIPMKRIDLVIVDSVGMPVLRKFASMSVKERGDALLDIINWLGVLKEWTYKNRGIAFVSNQPQSEFGKTSMSEKGDNRSPFGDKSNFIPGHIFLAKKDLDSPERSTGHWVAFRSRAHGKMEKVFHVEVIKGVSKIELL